MTTVVHVSTEGWPTRLTIRRHYDGSSNAEVIELPRWSELHIAITTDQSIQTEDVTSEDWQDKPKPPSTSGAPRNRFGHLAPPPRPAAPE